MDLLIVGNAGGTNVGASLHRAASAMGLTSTLCDARSASSGSRIASSLSWRLLGHRPLHLDAFSRSVVEECRRERPAVLISTGLAPLKAASLEEIGKAGIFRINYSTDDPWNPAFRSSWFSAALRMYDRVHTVRKSNLDDLVGHGCKQVRYLPFGYDESLWLRPDEPGSDGPGDGEVDADSPSCSATDVFFAGAADRYRVRYMRELVNNGIRVALAGDYWRRIPDLRRWALGHLSSARLKTWTRGVPVSLCLVRRANRDGHVMRSFEIPAIGACMAAEDTEEHREIFGEDGNAVRYFRSPMEAVVVVKQLLIDDSARRRLAGASHAMITGSGNSYKDRLASLLSSVEGAPGFRPTRPRVSAAAVDKR